MEDLNKIYQECADETTTAVREFTEKFMIIYANTVSKTMAAGGGLSSMVMVSRIMESVMNKAMSELTVMKG